MRAEPEIKREKKPAMRSSLVIAIVLMILLITGLLLYRFRVQPVSTATPLSDAPEAGLSNAAITINLYFAGQEDLGPRLETRKIEPEATTIALIKKIIAELKNGPVSPGLIATVPPTLQVKSVYISHARIFIDFQSESLDQVLAGPTQERLLLQSLVLSIIRSIGYTYESVTILAGGKEISGRHLYLAREYPLSEPGNTGDQPDKFGDEPGNAGNPGDPR